MGYQSLISFLCVLSLLHASDSTRLYQPPIVENDPEQWEINRDFLVSAEMLLTKFHDSKAVEVEGATNESTNNLCMQGHLVPEFFLLGAMKTSTTTLAKNIHTSDGIYFPGHDRIKELHFFDQSVTLENKRKWLKYYPKCSFKQRAVAVDCTPGYIRANHSAKLIADFYGDLKSKIKFVLMLREPLARAQSAFYHHKSHKGRIPKTLTFNEFSKMHLKDGFDSYEIMWGSQYVQQLQKYFDEFESAQFMIVPFRCNYDPTRCGISTSLTETLWDMLGVPPGHYDQHLHVNVHKHPKLISDLDSDILMKAMEQVGSIAPDMAKLLASSNAKLFGYTGKGGDEVSIEKWLRNGW